MVELQLAWYQFYCKLENNYFFVLKLLYTHTVAIVCLLNLQLLTYFIRRLKGGFEGNSHWIFTEMSVNVHNLTCYSIEVYANIYKCKRHNIPLICFEHCIFV